MGEGERETDRLKERERGRMTETNGVKRGKKMREEGGWEGA